MDNNIPSNSSLIPPSDFPVNPSPQDKKKYTVLLFICSIIVLLVSIVVILLTKNSNNHLSQKTVFKDKKIITTAVLSPTAFPAVTKTEKDIFIYDGSVYLNSSSGKQIFINKKDFFNDYSRNFYFAQAIVSPDKSKILIQGQGYLLMPIIFYSPMDKISMKRIGIVASEAIWSPNGRYIAYNSKPADAGPLTRVYIYDTNQDTQVLISGKIAIAGIKYDLLGFDKLAWVNDNTGVKVHYTAYVGSSIPEMKQTDQGEIILPL